MDGMLCRFTLRCIAILLELLRREALLAVTARALEITYAEPLPAGRAKPRPMLRKDAVAFRRKFLAALTRQQQMERGRRAGLSNGLADV